MKETKTIIDTVEFNSIIPNSLKLLPEDNSLSTSRILRTTVESVLRSKVLNADIEEQDAFYVADMSEIVRQYQQWRALLPRVRPFYAVKCNPDPVIIKTLAECGTGFDCASRAELKLCFDAGVAANDIIYANPCKQASHIRYAANNNVNVMTFDNADELYKVKSLNPDAKMVLRILTDDSKSKCRFGVKFGASLQIVPSLLETAKRLDVDVIGISFHVGSGCYDATSFTDAVELARKAFDIGAALGFNFELLDIGGGFPGNTPEGLQFKDIAAILGPTIDRLFPPSIQVISEPGRYFACSALTLAVNVTSRRVIPRDTTDATSANDHPSYMYYVNDGMYGSFNCITFDHAVVKAYPLCRSGKFLYKQVNKQPEFVSSIWGPTCDSIDLISKDILLPEMKIGDWIGFSNMGAYTCAAASTFNGFKKSSIIYIYSDGQ